MVGLLGQPECEAADHVASVLRKQREVNTGVEPGVSFSFNVKPYTLVVHS